MKDKEFNELLQYIENSTFVDNKLIINGEDFLQQQRCNDALNDEQAITLANTLKKRPDITKVYLVNSFIADKGAAALAKVDTIEELCLFYNEIKTDGVKALADSNLKTLDLNSNFISFYRTFPKIVESMSLLGANKTITYLNLHNCQIPSKAIAELIKSNNTTTKLDISLNNLTDEALKHIKDNITLQTLIMYKNPDITNKGIKYISQNSSLTNLDLGDNKNINEVAGKLLANHATLKTLSLNDTELTIEQIREMFGPATLFDDDINKDTDLSGDSSSDFFDEFTL